MTTSLFFLIKDTTTTNKLKKFIEITVQFLVGFVIIIGSAAIFFAQEKALADFVSSVFLFNFFYISEGGNIFTSSVIGFLYLLVPTTFSVLLFSLLIFNKIVNLSETQKIILLFSGCLFLISLPLSLLSGRPYPHYFIPWLVPLSVFCAFFYFSLNHLTINSMIKNITRLLAWSSLISAIIFGIWLRAGSLLANDNMYKKIDAVTDVQAYVRPNQTLFIWGNETNFALLADLNLTGRIIYITPLLTPGYGEKFVAETLLNLQENHPIIVDTSPTDPFIPSLKEISPRYPYLQEIHSYVQQNYILTGTAGTENWLIWQHK